MESEPMQKPSPRHNTDAQREQKRDCETKRRADRLAFGCCAYCGSPRVSDEIGGTPKACAVCAQKHRERSRAYSAAHPGASNAGRDHDNLKAWRAAQKQRWKAAGKCVICGKNRHPTHARYCLTCRTNENTRAAAYRQRKREEAAQEAGRSTQNLKPVPVGAALPRLEGGRFRVTVGLDTRTKTAVENMVRHDRDRQAAQGRIPHQTHQISRLVRNAIRPWHGLDCHPPKQPFGIVRRRLTVCLDETCRATVQYQARFFFGGNVSKTLRAMLCAAQSPRRAVTAPRGRTVFKQP